MRLLVDQVKCSKWRKNIDRPHQLLKLRRRERSKYSRCVSHQYLISSGTAARREQIGGWPGKFSSSLEENTFGCGQMARLTVEKYTKEGDAER